MYLEIDDLLNRLAKKRPVFHSEADFQHALAWELHEKYPQAKIRLEYPTKVGIMRSYCDVWVMIDGRFFVFELKYKTRSLKWVDNGESFNLVTHGAADLARYDFIKDICRLEILASSSEELTGFAIFLTNEQLYWKFVDQPVTFDAAFRIHEGVDLRGELSWHVDTGGAKNMREVALNLKNRYTLQWQDYSNLGDKDGLFRYVALQIT